MSDKIKLQGIMEQGYGISPKLVMRDKNLTIEAKAIYAYMSSFAGNGESAFPRVDTACKDLNISRNRFNKHRKLLEDNGYISIEKQRKKGGKFDNNIYIINQIIESPWLQNTTTVKHRDGKTPQRQNEATNNNKELTNNKVPTNNKDINSSSSNAHEFFSQNFGMLNPFIAENITDWINHLSEELVVESMKLALKANKKFNYAEGILKAWLKDNVKTIEDVRAKEAEFEKRGDNNGVYGRGNGYAGNTPKGTSYEQAIAEAERARKSFGRG